MKQKLDKSILKKIKKNKIFQDLSRLNILNYNNLILFNNRTRDLKIPVIADKKSRVIFLSDISHSSKVLIKEIDQFESKNLKNNISIEKYKNKKVSLIAPDDDLRRFSQLKKIIKNKNVLDFGCGIGTFIKLAKKVTKNCDGLEVNKKLISKLRNKIKLFSQIDAVDKKYDFITMFHVLEHIPNFIETLRSLKKILKKNGKLIIEIPHAKDILFNVDEFKEFSLWSEHLILHTSDSISKILKFCGYKNITVEYVQRYSFANHLGWFLKKKPQGHVFFKHFYNKNIDKKYNEYLKKNKITDTLIVTAAIN